MDRRQHDYAASSGLPYAQQQVPNFQQQPQQFGFHPQHQQYPPPMNASGYMPPPPMQHQFPYQQQLHPPQMFNQQHPPHHHLPPPFPGQFDSAPPHPPPPPPADPELQKRIDKLVEYSVKNGPEFEAMMRDRQKDNPDYAFLFGGEGHGYYRFKQFISMHHPPGGGPFDPQFPPPSMIHHPPPNPMMSPGGALGVPPVRQPPFPPFHDHQQHHLPPFAPPLPHARPDFDQSTHAFRGLSGPLPADVAVELNSVLANLNGTKDSIKSAKIWFMQRSPFAPALAEALRDRVFATDDSEKQMHIVYLANDILFDRYLN